MNTKTIDLQTDLEAFFVSNQKLDQISAHLDRFNPIHVMKMAHMEIRHSAILGWLLNPHETHRLGDKVLTRFLSIALSGNQLSSTEISALSILHKGMRDAEVQIEWNNIDILVTCPTNKWVVIIENKFHSSQHSNQLDRYYDKALKHFPTDQGWKHVGVFLTLHGEESADDRYCDIQYNHLVDCIESILTTERDALPTEVAVFIEHYLDILKEATGMDQVTENLRKLARQLYIEHKKAIDFIIEHGRSNSLHLGIANSFGEEDAATPDYPFEAKVGDKSYRIFRIDSGGTGFLPMDWIDALRDPKPPWSGCENYWAELPVIIWVNLQEGKNSVKGTLRIGAEIGPVAPYAQRAALIDEIEHAAISADNNNIKFRAKAKAEGAKYSRFIVGGKNQQVIQDIDDAEEIRTAFTKILKNCEPELDIISKALKSWFDELANVA
ncbi:MAG: PD-(D/E)XK nuclease family protein [Pseudomonadota bacterium]|nr:PD-(D/E)XK nuclease family protein [Pseudomonadota bacterium]